MNHDAEQASSDALYKGRVVDTKAVGDRYLLMRIHTPLPLPHRPGQHVAIWFHDAIGAFHRYYSLAAAPDGQVLEFCFQLTDDARAGAILKTLTTGSELALSHPRGEFRLVDRGRPLVFIAGGSGIAPIRSFIHEWSLSHDSTTTGPAKATLVYGCRDADAVPYLDEFLRLEQTLDPRFKAFVVAECGTYPGVHRGNVLGILPQVIAADAHYYLCGPPAMVRGVVDFLKMHGMTKDAIFQEP